MEKYEEMCRYNRIQNQAKEDKAIEEINDMLRNKERITVLKLAKATGLSRDFFYKNPCIREAVNSARKKQGNTWIEQSRADSLNKAMEKRIAILEKENREKDALIKELKMQIVTLRKG